MENQNFISVDEKTARNSYGEFFTIGDNVEHEDVSVLDIAIIEKFEIDKESNEIKAHTNKGWAHIDFISKIKEKN